jgi:hypothetical protein
LASAEHPGNNQAAIIAPDGVAKVAIGTLSAQGRPSAHWFQNVTAAVHDNVAAVSLNTPRSKPPAGARSHHPSPSLG